MVSSASRRGPTKDSKWKYFERLVAAIHKAVDAGATVVWNDRINGRQFDATIRFRKGFYDYLTVIECKDYKKSVSVEKMDAFVTKARSVGAHRVIMASTSDFQEGAKKVARDNNVVLLTVSEDVSHIGLDRFGAKLGDKVDALRVSGIVLKYADGQSYELSKEAHELQYYVNHIIIERNGVRARLDDMVKYYQPRFLELASTEYKTDTIPCFEGCTVVGPDDGEIPLKLLAAIDVRFAIVEAQGIVSRHKFDLYLLRPNIKVTNLATGEEISISQHDLDLGIGTEIKIGCYYEIPQLSMYYYCEKIENDVITFYLVESYQHGQLVQCVFDQKKEDAVSYVEVEDNRIIARLQRRLQHLKEAVRSRAA
jgi:hypothetical protein